MIPEIFCAETAELIIIAPNKNVNSFLINCPI